jgi:hypothetical protein
MNNKYTKTIKNAPRCTGKTTSLKLHFQENHSYYMNTVVITPWSDQTSELVNYCSRFAPNIRTTYRGLIGDCLILIDEVYELSDEAQKELLMGIDSLEKRGFGVAVYAVGTQRGNILESKWKV